MEEQQAIIPFGQDPGAPEFGEVEFDVSNPFPDRSCSIFEVEECVFVPESCGLSRGAIITPLTNLGAQIGCYASLQVSLQCPVVSLKFGWLICGFGNFL